MFRLRRIISFLLLTLCLQWIVPPSLWHSICDHEDTIDHFYTDQVTISIQHEHCLILELSLPPMHHQEDHHEINQDYFYVISYSFIVPDFPVIKQDFFEGRGPPQTA